MTEIVSAIIKRSTSLLLLFFLYVNESTKKRNTIQSETNKWQQLNEIKSISHTLHSILSIEQSATCFEMIDLQILSVICVCLNGIDIYSIFFTLCSDECTAKTKQKKRNIDLAASIVLKAIVNTSIFANDL